MKDTHFTATIQTTSGGRTAHLTGEGDMVVLPSSANAWVSDRSLRYLASDTGWNGSRWGLKPIWRGCWRKQPVNIDPV